jgi:hypothetical protein
MSINIGDDKKLPTDTEAYYETVASQEEIYLEEAEEEVRAILTSDYPSSLTKQTVSITEEDSYSRLTERVDEQLDQAAQELIAGDSDDPPLSDDAVAEMLRVSLTVRRLGPI